MGSVEVTRLLTDYSGVYICNSIVNDLKHGNFICKSPVQSLEAG